MTKSLLDSYLEIAKNLKGKNELDPDNDTFMSEIYDRLTDAVCAVMGEPYRTTAWLYIKKRFEEELQ